MDPFEAHNITFLDLTGVDDLERQEVLNSLYSENSNVELPWKVSDNKFIPKTDEPKNRRLPAKGRRHPDDREAPPPPPPSHHHRPYHRPEYGAYVPPPPEPYAAYPPPPALGYAPHYVVYSAVPPAYHRTFAVAPVVAGYVHYVGAGGGGEEEGAAGCFDRDGEREEEGGGGGDGEAEAGGGQESGPSCAYDRDKKRGSSPSPGAQAHHHNGDLPPKAATPPPPVAPPASRSWASLFSGGGKAPVGAEAGADAEKTSPSSGEAVNGQTNGDDDALCPIKHPRRAHAQFADPNCYRMGEFLLNHNVDGRTISLQPRGLINRSNYCYINSILQALLACPPVYNLLTGLSEQNGSNEKEKATPVIDGMCRFVKEFQHLPAGQRVNRRNEKNQKKDQGVLIDYDLPFEPSWIYKMLNGVRTDSFLVEGRQEDAEEFLGCLLNGLNDEMLELMKLVKSDLAVNKFEDKSNESDKEWQVMGPKNKGSITRQTDFVKTPISNIFGGFLKSRIQRTGDHSTYNIQPFFTLQLNIEKVKTVREALEALVSKNQLEGVTSEKTNEEVEAWQQVTLEELPIILILHLKCFDFKQEGCTKIVKALEFPIDLKIDSKLLSSKSITPKEKQYKLFAVVYHDGKEATKGHYITDAFHVGYSSWIRYDDASVKPVQEENVLKPQGTRVPYLLFYRRSDTIRSK